MRRPMPWLAAALKDTMKVRLVLASCFATLLFGSLAATGPEVPNSLGRVPQLRAQDVGGPSAIIFTNLNFPERLYGLDGWDFGGRAGYGCGFMEVVDGGATASLTDDRVIARVVLEQYDKATGNFPDDRLYIRIDSNLAAGNDIPCFEDYPTLSNYPLGAGIATDVERSRSTFAGEPNPAHGHTLQVWQDGVEVARLDTPHAEPQGSFSWWFRGDEDGEIILWYQKLATPAGCSPAGCFPSMPEEYGIVGRVSVVTTEPGVTFDDCVELGTPDDLCPQAYPNETITQVTLGAGFSDLVCSDGVTSPTVVRATPLRVSCPLGG